MDAKTISKYIIDKCTNEGHPVTNFQLQLILYFIQINFMKLLNVAAFDEDIEAWKNGPVIPAIYYEYDYCAGTPIYETYKDAANTICLTYDKEIIDAVIEGIRDESPWDLVKSVVQQGTPYRQVYYGKRIIIPKKSIYEYARNLREEK